MALHYDFTKIKNWETVTRETVPVDEVTDDMRTLASEWRIDENDGSATRQRPITSTLIWACMFCDMRGITQENYIEFYARVHLYEKLNGVFMQTRVTEDGKTTFKERPVKLDDVKAHIGLSCNVSTVRLNTWRNRLVKKFTDEVIARKTRIEEDARETV